VTTPFDMNSNQPYMAVATTNNSGYELMFAYFDTDRMWRKYTGNTLYNFKPGKTTGMHQLNNNGYAVYPNPVNRELNITQADGADYALMDITGRTILTGRILGEKASINTSGLAVGMYMLQLSKDGYTEQVKFIKK
ncbi:MAG: T9SS type A sorting domain-containing protein, partial [Taibaiella sp.]|nr:T9SS type A sorting domain-containing protein [Taibaiella sp.]